MSTAARLLPNLPAAARLLTCIHSELQALDADGQPFGAVLVCELAETSSALKTALTDCLGTSSRRLHDPSGLNGWGVGKLLRRLVGRYGELVLVETYDREACSWKYMLEDFTHHDRDSAALIEKLTPSLEAADVSDLDAVGKAVEATVEQRREEAANFRKLDLYEGLPVKYCPHCRRPTPRRYQRQQCVFCSTRGG